MLGVMVISLMVVGVVPVGAVEWERPVYVYGAQLTDTEVGELAELMGYDLEELESMSVSAQDKVDLMGYGNPDSNMYSSAIIVKQPEGSGIEVEINRVENITKITIEQYTNAMITAGVEDAKVIVDSPKPVTGESALAGIYKVYDEKGEGLEQDRMEVAQEELETTASISDSLSGEDSSALDDAIIEIKQQLAELKDGQLTEEMVEKIVNKALEKRGLHLIISDEHVERLVKLFFKYGQTSAVDSEAVKQQLSELSESVGEKLGDLKDWAEDVGFFEAVGNFFKGLWEVIQKVFSNEEEGLVG